jgi:hypothetical protein
MSPEWILRAKSVCDFLVVFCGTIAAVATLGVWHFGSLKDDLADKEIAELRAKIAPRKLTSEQRATFIRNLSADPGTIVIVSSMMDSESAIFADDFEGAFQKAGWKTHRERMHSTLSTGVAIGTVTGTTLGDTQRVEKVLAEIGVPHLQLDINLTDHSIPSGFQSNVLYLVVMHKPHGEVLECKSNLAVQ